MELNGKDKRQDLLIADGEGFRHAHEADKGRAKIYVASGVNKADGSLVEWRFVIFGTSHHARCMAHIEATIADELANTRVLRVNNVKGDSFLRDEILTLLCGDGGTWEHIVSDVVQNWLYQNALWIEATIGTYTNEPVTCLQAVLGHFGMTISEIHTWTKTPKRP